jgi:hypothetical protein
MIFEFNVETAGWLKKNGWSPTRKINAKNHISKWKDDGYDVFALGIEFAKSFAGINLPHPSFNRISQDKSFFDPVVATRRFNRLWAVEVYEGLAGQKLLPVGQGYSEHLTYLLGDGGGLFGGFDDYFCEVGPTLEDALFCILHAKPFISLSA